MLSVDYWSILFFLRYTCQTFLCNISYEFHSWFLQAASDDVAEKMEMAFIQLLLGSAGANNNKEVLNFYPVSYPCAILAYLLFSIATYLVFKLV